MKMKNGRGELVAHDNSHSAACCYGWAMLPCISLTPPVGSYPVHSSVLRPHHHEQAADSLPGID